MLAYRSFRLAPLALLLMACSAPPPEDATEAEARPAIMAVNYPLQYFAERIGGDLVNVRCPAPDGVDPAYWTPDAPTVMAYQQADLILLNGAGYAGWTEKVSLPASRLVNTSKAFQGRYLEVDDLVRHSHGPEGEHAHGGTAFTTWLDPSLATLQARSIADALKGLLPDAEDAIEAHFDALEANLVALDAALREVTAQNEEEPLLASHPVYQYIARAYGWNLRSMHWEPDEMPDEEQWHELEHLLEDHRARWMIWETPPDDAIAARLKQHGVGSVVFYTCGNTPDSGDYLSTMKENIERLRSVFQSD